MKNIEVENLTEGTVIFHKRGMELELRFRRKWNDNLYIFDGVVFDDEDDMDGHFSSDKEVVLTKSELNDWYIND